MIDDHSLTVLEVVFISIGTKPMVSLEALHICLYLLLWVLGKTTSRSVYKHSLTNVCVCTHMCAHYAITHTVKLFYYYLQAYFMCWKYNVSTTFNVLFLLVALFGVISQHTNTTWQWHYVIQFGTQFCCRYGKLRLLLS